MAKTTADDFPDTDRDSTGGKGPPGNITIGRSDLTWATGQGIITDFQAGELWQALVKKTSSAGSQADTPTAGPASGRKTSGFDIAHLLWYGGGVLVLLAMGWLMGVAAADLKAPGFFSMSVLYAAGFAILGRWLYFKQEQRVPGGLMFTLAVIMTPFILLSALDMGGVLGTYSTQEVIAAELATIAVGAATLRFVRFPFLTMPVFASVWMLAYSVTDLIIENNTMFGAHNLEISMVLGGIIALISFFVDRKSEEDYAFWGYLFGVLTFWGAYSWLDKGSEAGMFVYFAVNVALMFVSIVLQRRIFMIVGSLGAVGYLLHLAWTIFEGSMLFPVALVAMGIGIIFAGIQYNRNREAIEARILSVLPPGLIGSLRKRQQA